MKARSAHRPRSRSVLALAAGLILMGASQSPGLTASSAKAGKPGKAVAAKRAPLGVGLSSLPPEAQPTISATLGRDDEAYHVATAGKSLHADNPGNGFQADFTRDGIRLRSGTAQWGMRLQGVGYGTASRTVKAATPCAEANRVEYRRGVVTEWYVNGPVGLEQGFTLKSPPAKRTGQPLTLALELSGDLSASLDAGGEAVTLARAGGVSVLRYRGLTASDASGRDLRAWMELKGGDLLLRVEEAGADYPIVVDPFVQQAKLTASDGLADNQLGYSVAVSGDTVVVGAPGNVNDDIVDPGAVYVFVKPAGGWATMTESARLTASDPDSFSDDGLGYSVAIDGDAVVAGAPYGEGKAYLFVKPAGGWATMTETAKLMSSSIFTGVLFGVTVAISGDTVVVGAPQDFAEGSAMEDGAVYVFVKPVGGWMTMTATAQLSGTDPEANDYPYGTGYGWAAAISGNTVAVGVRGDDVGADFNQGAVYLYVEPAGGWVTTSVQDAWLSATDGAPFDTLGWSVAMSGDTLVAGAWQDDIGSNSNQGSAYVFVKPAGGWVTATETAKLTSSDGAAGDRFGSFVAIDGATVVVGAHRADIGANADQGAAYVFSKPAAGWVTGTESAKLTTSDGAAGDFFGFSVAISGAAVAAGANLADIGANLNQGSAHVFGMGGSCDDGNPCTDDSSGPSGCVTTPNSNPCDDGDACTQSDACQSGTCTGGDPVICAASDQCHVAGVCDSGTGLCSNLSKADGTTCSDGDACTQTDMCQSGTCTGGNPVTCTASDQCHDAGVCNPTTGICSDPVRPNGVACSDGNACTQTDTCQAGACSGGNFAWSGVLDPVNIDGSSIFRFGSTIPVKFRLTDACAGNSTLIAHIYLAKVSNMVIGTEFEATSVSAADTGNSFRYAGDDQYIFNLSTKPLSTGTWQIRIDLGDGVINRVVNISLRK